jgi:hypothetical protein
MAFQVSAGVEVKEIDLTNVVPAVSTSIGGYAGQFRWGPIEEIQLIGSETELANEFGKPDDYHARSFYTASSFLKYGNALKVVRSTDDALKNAASSPAGGRITGIVVDASPNHFGVLSALTSSSNIGNNEFTVTSTVGSGASVAPKYNIDSPNTSVASAGTAYVVNDFISANLGDNTVAQFLVTSVSGSGGITGIQQRDASPGINYDSPSLTKPTVFSNTATTGGTGSGAQLNIAYKLKSLSVINQGSNYFANNDIAVAEGDSPKLKLFKDGIEIYPRTQGNHNLSPSVTAAATSTGATLIKNEDNFESLETGLKGAYYSRYAGVLGNGTNVYVVDSSNAGTLQIGTGTKASTLANSQFDSSPGADEIHVLITSTSDALTGNGSVETEVERWPFVGSLETSRKADGTNNYFKEVINKGSDWVYALDAGKEGGKYDLGGGVDSSSRTDGDVVNALDLFADSETVDVNLLFTEADTDGSTVLANKVLSLATARKDAVGFITPAIEDTVNTTKPLENVKDFLQSTSATITPRNSYGVLGSTAVYVYDKFNDKFLYIGTQGHLAGLCANTDSVAQPWFSPGGFNRGQLRGVTKLAYNPKKVDRDELYKAGINPLVTFPGQGTVLFGDKTLQAKPSAFDRINVRRLFITLEKAIATAAKFQLFELNDEFTRASFRNLVEPFLRDVQGRRGITDFLVVCDETNNTGNVIDSNRFVADIFIKPARSINFITLNFIATRTGVEFSEIVGNV